MKEPWDIASVLLIRLRKVQDEMVVGVQNSSQHIYPPRQRPSASVTS